MQCNEYKKLMYVFNIEATSVRKKYRGWGRVCVKEFFAEIDFKILGIVIIYIIITI